MAGQCSTHSQIATCTASSEFCSSRILVVHDRVKLLAAQSVPRKRSLPPPLHSPKGVIGWIPPNHRSSRTTFHFIEPGSSTVN